MSQHDKNTAINKYLQNIVENYWPRGVQVKCEIPERLRDVSHDKPLHESTFTLNYTCLDIIYVISSARLIKTSAVCYHVMIPNSICLSISRMKPYTYVQTCVVLHNLLDNIPLSPYFFLVAYFFIIDFTIPFHI